MTVGELKSALKDVPDHFPVLQASTWKPITKARADSYLRALPPNVFIVFTEHCFDPYESNQSRHPLASTRG